MRSLSRGRRNSSRGTSRNRNKKYGCIACKCIDCEKIRKISEGLNVNYTDWSEDYNEVISVNFTERGKQVMILDLGAPVSVAGDAWIKQYLEAQEIELRDLKTHECHQVFKFGPSKQYVSNTMIDLPVIVRRLNGKEEVLQVYTYLIEADVPFLCGKREMVDRWKSIIDTEKNIMECKIDGENRIKFRTISTVGKHLALELERGNLRQEQILFTEENEDMNSLKPSRKFMK